MFLLSVLLVPLLVFVGVSYNKKRRHITRANQLTHRVHVNGIRGKSSVTRLIAAAFREGGIPTVAKTTGTAARIIYGHEDEVPIERKEPDIREQRETIKRVLNERPETEAIVFECMAVNPIYQRYLEEQVMHSTIGVITNVRRDHTDLMGESLKEIAQSLANTIPHGGHLVTSESEPSLQRILIREADRRGGTVHVVTADEVTVEEITRFSYFQYRANVAVALKVAELVGIDRETAMRGMLSATPDPGAFRIEQLAEDGPLYWANLFAVNDTESFVATTRMLSKTMGSEVKLALILNNRKDRPERVSQFAELATGELAVDVVFTMGCYEDSVERHLRASSERRNGDGPRVVRLGDQSPFRHADGATLKAEIIRELGDSPYLVLGGANIHTRQAHELLAVL